MRAGALLAGLACVLAAWCHAAYAAPVPSGAALDNPAPAGRLDSDLKEFVSRLERFRGGAGAELDPLAACARRCRLERPDLHALVTFYGGMSVEERTLGLAREQQVEDLRKRVLAAGRDESLRETWPVERASILADLDELVRACRSETDFTAAARGLALRARILRERVVEDAGIDEATRIAWTQNGVRDAEDALALFERAGYVTPKLEPMWVLAWLDWARGDATAAEEGFESLLVLARHVGQKLYAEHALNGLVRLAQEAGDLDRAAPLLDELARLQSPRVSWNLAALHATFLLAIDAADRAAEFLAQHKPASERDLSGWHVLMAGALARKGDSEAARAHELVLESEEDQNPVARLALAEARLRRGDTALALADLEAMTGLEGSSATLRARHEGARGTALLRLGRRTEAVRAFERAIAVGDSLQSRLQLGGGLTQTSSVIGEIVGLETVALLARAHLEDGAALAAAAVIEDRQSRALRTAVSGSPATRIDADAMRAWAAAYELGIVTWVIGADTSVVVCVSRSGDAQGAILPFGRRALETGVRRLREAVIGGDDSRIRDLAAELQATLFPPSALKVFGAATGRVLLCAHGVLERLPFDVLPDFVERGLVPVVLPGLVDSTPGAGLTPSSIAAWSILGDPRDDRGRSALAGVRAELDSVRELHPSVVLAQGADFDRSALAEALKSGRALHLATHLTSDQPKSSTLDTRLAYAAFELSNGGRFGLADIRRARPKLPLAVLSACESAGGEFVDGEAALGVAKGFLESGTRNLLVTHWPVEDEAARVFAVAFHRALAGGLLPSLAAALGRAELRERGFGSADWAAFRLLGRD